MDDNRLNALKSWMIEHGFKKLNGHAKDVIIELINKNISMEPLDNINDPINKMCPICKEYVGYVDALSADTYNYCKCCGQKILWTQKKEDKSFLEV